jgi:hypothetical protein
MATTTDRNKNMVVAREAIVVNVGGRPTEYGKITVTDRRSGERKEILDTDNDPIDPGDPGTPYAFKAFQRVHKSHPAVKANPGAFMSADEVDEDDDGA